MKRIVWAALIFASLPALAVKPNTHSKKKSPSTIQKNSPSAGWDFPCSIPPTKRKVKLRLYGETHDFRSSQTWDERDSRFDNQERQLFKEALRGDVLLGLEGFPRLGSAEEAWLARFQRVLDNGDVDNRRRKNFAGIENEDSHVFGMTYKVHNYWSNYAIKNGQNPGTREARMGQFWQLVGYIILYPSAKKAWTDLRRPFSERGQEQAASLVDKALEFGSYSDALSCFESTPDLTKKTQTLVNSGGMGKTLQAWSRSFAWIMETRALPSLPSQDPIIAEALSVAREANTNPDKFLLDKEFQNRYFEVLVRKRRNLDWAKNISHLYCRALKEGKPLKVLMGSNHLDDLKARLEKMARGHLVIEAIK